MILETAYKRIGRKTGLSFSETSQKEIMRDAMDEALRELFRRVKLVGTKEETSFTTVSGTFEYFLDDRVLVPTSFRDITNGNEIIIQTEEKFNREIPDPDFTDLGEPTIIIPKGKVRIKAQPTSDSIITVVSDSTADDIASLKFVSIIGLSNGVQTTIRLQLNGTTPVISIVTFTEIFAVSKNETTGNITITTNSGAVEIDKIQPTKNENTRWRVHLLEKVPDAALTIKFSYYRRPWDFINDEDIIPIDEIWEDVFFAKTVAIIFQEQGDTRATNAETISEKKMTDMADDDYFAENMDLRFGFDGVSYENFE